MKTTLRMSENKLAEVTERAAQLTAEIIKAQEIKNDADRELV